MKTAARVPLNVGDTKLLPHVEAGKGLIDALMEIHEYFRPVMVSLIRSRLCKDRETREFYLANPYRELIVLLDKFPRLKLLAFLRRNNL
jgi:hypothetical protein